MTKTRTQKVNSHQGTGERQLCGGSGERGTRRWHTEQCRAVHSRAKQKQRKGRERERYVSCNERRNNGAHSNVTFTRHDAREQECSRRRRSRPSQGKRMREVLPEIQPLLQMSQDRRRKRRCPDCDPILLSALIPVLIHGSGPTAATMQRQSSESELCACVPVCVCKHDWACKRARDCERASQGICCIYLMVWTLLRHVIN